MNRKLVIFLMRTPLRFLVRFYIGQEDWHWPFQTLHIIENGKSRWEKWKWLKDWDHTLYYKLSREIPDKHLYRVIQACAVKMQTSDTWEGIK